MINEVELLKLLRSAVPRNPAEIKMDLEYSGKLLSPIVRRNLFLKELTEARKRKEEWVFRGFILPAPKGIEFEVSRGQNRKDVEEGAVYLVLSPLRLAEQKELSIDDRVYLLLKIYEHSKVAENVKIDDYVEVVGFIEGSKLLPTGDGSYKRVDVVHVKEIYRKPVEDYWAMFESYMLSPREVLDIFENTFISERNIVKTLIYGFIGSPEVLDYRMPEGFTLGIFQRELEVIQDFIRAMKYFTDIFPKEFLLSNRTLTERVTEPLFGIWKRRIPVPKAGYEYYFNYQKNLLKKSIPLPKWVEEYLIQHKYSIYSPKITKITLNDEFAKRSEAFWVLRGKDDFEFEIYREIKDLAPNLLVTFAKLRSDVRMIRVEEKLQHKFRAILSKLLLEYGYGNAIFETDVLITRYRMGLTFWGASYRFERDKDKALREFKIATKEMLERWIENLDRNSVKSPYKNRQVEAVMRIFSELEAVYPDGVPVEEFILELERRGFKNPSEIVSKLIIEGYLLYCSTGRLKSV